jgi:hypothetical protein
MKPKIDNPTRMQSNGLSTWSPIEELATKFTREIWQEIRRVQKLAESKDRITKQQRVRLTSGVFKTKVPEKRRKPFCSRTKCRYSILTTRIKTTQRIIKPYQSISERLSNKLGNHLMSIIVIIALMGLSLNITTQSSESSEWIMIIDESKKLNTSILILSLDISSVPYRLIFLYKRQGWAIIIVKQQTDQIMFGIILLTSISEL